MGGRYHHAVTLTTAPAHAAPSSQPGQHVGDEVDAQIEAGEPDEADNGESQRPDRDLAGPRAYDPSAQHPGAEQADGSGPAACPEGNEKPWLLTRANGGSGR